VSSRLFVCLLLSVLLSGCQHFSATRVEEVTSQRPSPATLQKLLLVGITTTSAVQATMEKEFARQLGDRYQVVLASQWYPGEKQPLRDEVVARMKAEGVTGVLAVRLLSYEVASDTQPASAFSLYSPGRTPGARVGWDQDPWIAGASGPMGEAPVVAEGNAMVESRLYDVASGKVVWEARSRTLHHGNAEKELEGFVFSILQQLRKSGWH
jgi:hypothetical protein